MMPTRLIIPLTAAMSILGACQANAVAFQSTIVSPPPRVERLRLARTRSELQAGLLVNPTRITFSEGRVLESRCSRPPFPPLEHVRPNPRKGTVVVSLVDSETGKPLPGFIWILAKPISGTSTDPSARRMRNSDSTGIVNFTGLLSGTYSLGLGAIGYWHRQESIDLPYTRGIAIRLRLVPYCLEL